ncbi:MAG: aminodeoxychorismate lyase [Porticoccaceae bacterium]|nr:aminodeoxychorismate lyase [Porticoccaceae bacterium]
MTTSKSYYSLNGQPIADSLPLNLLDDRGLSYGHGLFESILMHQSTLPLVNRHLDRLNRGANAVGIPIKSDLIYNYVQLFLEQLKGESISQGVVKVIVTAGVGGRGYKSPDTIEARVVCSYSNLPKGIEDYRNQAINVRFCKHRLPINQPLAGIKHLNRLDQILARNEWTCDNYHEGLMFSESGHLIEAVSGNIFVKLADCWLTPCVDQAGVSGVMRSLMLEEIFPACGIPLYVKPISMCELAESQSLLLCNSIKGLAEVGSVDNHDNQLFKSLPIDEQTLMLRRKLIELYPQYQ